MDLILLEVRPQLTVMPAILMECGGVGKICAACNFDQSGFWIEFRNLPHSHKDLTATTFDFALILMKYDHANHLFQFKKMNSQNFDH